VSTTWTVPRLSTEWVGPITVSDGTTDITDWTAGVFPRGYQPAGLDEIATPPTDIDGLLGVLIGPLGDYALDPGTYRIWVCFARPPEMLVLNDVGLIQVT
jgi:hypothetical protein